MHDAIHELTHDATEIGRFPDFEEVELEKSTVTLPLFYSGRFLEEVALDAVLRLRRYPVSEGFGRRRFEFHIQQWEVAGRSARLGCSLGFCLSDVPQPKSICIAGQPESDFPALIVYNGIYDVFVKGDRVLMNQIGLGVGTGVMQIPPRNISVSFDKPFSAGSLDVTAGNCTSMTSLAEADWQIELDRIIALRLCRD